MPNSFLQRGKGKHTGDIKKYDFFSHYRKNTQYEKLNRKEYDAFTSELLLTFATAIVRDNLEIKFGVLGKIRIQAKPLNFFNKKGEKNKSLRVNWKATWEYWETEYPDLSRQEITEIKNKTLIYHDNEHTNGEFYHHLWDKATAIVKYKSFYTFSPARQFARMIAEEAKKENRTVYYYG